MASHSFARMNKSPEGVLPCFKDTLDHLSFNLREQLARKTEAKQTDNNSAFAHPSEYIVEASDSLRIIGLTAEVDEKFGTDE